MFGEIRRYEGLDQSRDRNFAGLGECNEGARPESQMFSNIQFSNAVLSLAISVQRCIIISSSCLTSTPPLSTPT
jgi:hypothetical protein